jgi:alpha-glutamyl/putrescinyl thymine pyrophosphorylase clade 1
MGQEAMESFFRFINERHRIYLRKQASKDWPWSKNPILQTFKFTNVFRELDMTTTWLRVRWRDPYADHPDLWFAMAVARTINWPDTLEEIGFPDPWNPDRVAKVIADRMARGEKVFSDAYQGAVSRKKGQPRGDYVVERLDKLFQSKPPLHNAKTLQQAWNMLQGLPGMGGFIAYEVVTDLRWTRYLRDAPDIMTSGKDAHAGQDPVRSD